MSETTTEGVSPAATPLSAAAMRDIFLLDPEWTYLNHGSFGACPRPVFEAYQRLQLELERQPVAFLDRSYAGRVEAVRHRVAQFVGGDPEGIIFVPNTTTGVNTAARAVRLRPGDEILLSDQEYGACVYAWEAVAAQTGARLVTVSMPSPLAEPEGVLAAFEAAATDRSRVLFFSHLSSMTGAIFPATLLCRWGREREMVTIVDGAHVPGQLPLDLAEIGADVYIGNFHKWLCAPKGSAFCWVAPSLRDSMQPLVVSWGAAPGSSFVQRHSWSGTDDPAAVLAVPAAIAFTERHGWPVVTARGRELAAGFVAAAAERFGQEPLYPPGSAWHAQLVSAPVPWPGEASSLQQRLREEYRIEVVVRPWLGRILVRASFAAYNDSRHAERLLQALAEVL